MEQTIQDYLNGLCCTVTYNFDVESSDWTSKGITDQATFNSVLGVTTGAFAITGNKIEAEILTTTNDKLDFKGFGVITNVNYITVSGLQNLDLSSNQITTFNPTLALPSSLLNLHLNNNQLTTFNPTLALPSSLQNLGLSFNQITTFNPTLALPSSLQTLDLNNNQITTFNPTLALPSSLQYLYLNNNQLTTFNPNNSLPISLIQLNLQNNQITTAGYTTAETWANAQPAFTNNCNIYFNSNIDSVAGTNLETILLTKNTTIVT